MKQILLVGNGPYLNRGCEAIIRGTMSILSQLIGEPLTVTNLAFISKEVSLWQNEVDKDLHINHVALSPHTNQAILNAYMSLYNRLWSYQTVVKALRPLMKIVPAFNNIADLVKHADLIMDIGGDNLTFDYCFPANFFCLDDQIRTLKKSPQFLWGASLGELTKRHPNHQRIMMDQLNRFDHIFIRESLSYQLLKENHIENVSLMLDPAFSMAATKPENPISLLPQCIGINLSPMLGRYFPGGMTAWRKFSSQMIESLLKRFSNPILLIPHVTKHGFNIEDPYFCDYEFLSQVYLQLNKKDQQRVALLPPSLNAQEIKWYISQCHIFAGARTHSTIAAFSSFVPTLSFGYSLKAKGINQDIFDHLDYCLDTEHLTINGIADKIDYLLSHHAPIRQHLISRIPILQERSYVAWQMLMSKTGFKEVQPIS